ncbi:neuronal cell adhesion molecule-like [Antedon mediterranea]|uniref:neuronal cell adhesion molecule-like n=1 Tax=Antedon mediterranea TaxID=105859 RepID=UPI003AF58D97
MLKVSAVFIVVMVNIYVCAVVKEGRTNQTLDFIGANRTLIFVSPPIFLKTTTSQEVRLRCVPISMDFDVTWLRLNGILETNRSTISDLGQVLTITHVTVTDTGEYRCVVTNGTIQEERTVSLHVEASPFWTTKIADTILSPGESGSITCLAGGSPEPEITWSTDNNQRPTPSFNGITEDRIFAHGNQLRIRNAQKEDAGIVTCMAKNIHGSIWTQAYIIVVGLAPTLRIPMTNIQTTEGQNTNFVCDVIGAPKPRLSWLFNNTTINSSQRHTIYGNKLTIFGVTVSDSGVYTCLATSSSGELTTKASLIVREPTIVSATPKVVLTNVGKSIVFRCVVTSSNIRMVEDVNWYHNGSKISSYECNKNRFKNENDNSLIIMRMQQSYEGRYTCIANTEFDQAQDEVVIHVKTHPDAPRNVRMTQLDNFEVELTWDPGFDGNSPTSYFFIQYLLSKPYNWAIKTLISPNYTNTVIQLEPWKNYKFRVVQVNSIGMSPPSVETEIIQTASTRPTRNPDNVEATLNDDILITWEIIKDGINGPGFYYLVSWKGSKELEWESDQIPDSTIGAKRVRPASAFETYDVKIQSHNAMGSGPEPIVYTTRAA